MFVRIYSNISVSCSGADSNLFRSSLCSSVHWLIRRQTNKVLSSSFIVLTIFQPFFGSRHYICAFTYTVCKRWWEQEDGNISEDFSLFDLLHNAKFMNKFEFIFFLQFSIIICNCFDCTNSLCIIQKITPLSIQRKKWSIQ